MILMIITFKNINIFKIIILSRVYYDIKIYLCSGMTDRSIDPVNPRNKTLL